MEVSEYEGKRQRRIEQNQKKLQALGLYKLPDRTCLVIKKKVVDLSHPVRRSLRQQQENALDVPDSESKALLVLKRLPRQCKRPKVKGYESSDVPVAPQLALTKGKKVHVSSSMIDIEFEEFQERCLGMQLLPVGKQTVMQSLCPPGYVAKFSKMSGVQPWKNAIALFVNVESHSFYDNTFHQEMEHGRNAVHFQWFGQTRWQDESPLVRRLRNTKKGDECWKFNDTYDDKSETSEDPVLLFLRQTQGPYIYCGRLGYLGHRPAMKPLEFRWQLLDVNLVQWDKIRTLLR